MVVLSSDLVDLILATSLLMLNLLKDLLVWPTLGQDQHDNLLIPDLLWALLFWVCKYINYMFYELHSCPLSVENRGNV